MENIVQLVTAVIINYQTADLTERAVSTLRAFYPHLRLLLIDNGSRDSSFRVLQHYQERSPAHTQLLKNERNIFHGPAMHQALQTVGTKYAFFLDSDCEITTGGFIEQMVDIAERDSQSYAVGKLVYMNKRGFDVLRYRGAFPYIRPICMLIRKSVYFILSPFSHHGTPCLANMQDAVKRGYRLVDFPVFDYVVHKGRGTASRYGYGLGLRGKLNYLLNKFGL
jgi:glycosyltransferase involved in cell wall biosynthesis